MSVNKMWGGRFSQQPAKITQRINTSIDFDKRLYKQDIAVSIAHTKMLAQQKIIGDQDKNALLQGLQTIENEIATGIFPFSSDLEDIHMNIEARLKDIVGPAGDKLHTARSRNDQVATDMRLWIRESIEHISACLRELITALIDQAQTHSHVVMPGYTHLQIAQPVTFGHHLLAYVEMFGRDRSRFKDCHQRLNECPLGAAALAGTGFIIDRHATAKYLGFQKPTANSMDSVASRDFILEFLAHASICGIHLSRLAEDIILWSSPSFNFIALSDDLSTGSSIMPQKKNPDVAELVRAKPGRIIAALNSLLIVMKGLPMTYGKDLQEDKEQTFDASDSLVLILTATTEMIKKIKPNATAMRDALKEGFPTATDLADYLVRTFHIAFRKAHDITGSLVAMAEKKGLDLAQLSLKDMQSVEPRLTKEVYTVLSVDASVRSRTSFGGTSPENVRNACNDANKRFLKNL